jgi:hypothetical protein
MFDTATMKLAGMFAWVLALSILGSVLNYYMHKKAKGESVTATTLPAKVIIGAVAGLILAGVTRLQMDFFVIIIPALSMGFAGESVVGKYLGYVETLNTPANTTVTDGKDEAVLPKTEPETPAK